jgi:hypothetical protein
MQRTLKRSSALVATVLVGLGLVFALAACDDSNDSVDEAVDDAREDVEDVVGGAGARAAAEVLRGTLEATNLDANETLRDVAVLQENVDDVPGDPEVSGIEDADGDGKDDDGKVQLAVGDQEACVTVTDNGEVSVAGEAC